MRPTNLGFRSPKERTPEYYNSTFTYHGDDTKWSRRTFRKTTSSWGNEKRFIGYDQLFKRYSHMVGPGSYTNDQSSIDKSKIKGGRVYTGYHGDRPVWNNAYYFTGQHLVFEGSLVPISQRRNTSYDGTCAVDTSPQTNRTGTPGQNTYRSRSADPRNKEGAVDVQQARISIRSIRKRLSYSPEGNNRVKSAKSTVSEAYGEQGITMKRKRNRRIKKLLHRRLRKS